MTLVFEWIEFPASIDGTIEGDQTYGLLPCKKLPPDFTESERQTLFDDIYFAKVLYRDPLTNSLLTTLVARDGDKLKLLNWDHLQRVWRISAYSQIFEQLPFNEGGPIRIEFTMDEEWVKHTGG